MTQDIAHLSRMHCCRAERRNTPSDNPASRAAKFLSRTGTAAHEICAPFVDNRRESGRSWRIKDRHLRCVVTAVWLLVLARSLINKRPRERSLVFRGLQIFFL